MVGAVKYDNFDVNHWITSDNTGFHSFFNTVFYRSDVFTRNCTTYDLIFKFEASTWFLWNQFQPAVTILTTTTRLTYEFTFSFNSFTDSFAICYLRFTYVTIYFELTVHTVNDDIQVKFAHTRDNSLTCFFISTNFESRIFFCQTSKSCTHFFLVSFCFRFNSNGDNWFREFHGFKDYRGFFIT